VHPKVLKLHFVHRVCNILFPGELNIYLRTGCSITVKLVNNQITSALQKTVADLKYLLLDKSPTYLHHFLCKGCKQGGNLGCKFACASCQFLGILVGFIHRLCLTECQGQKLLEESFSLVYNNSFFHRFEQIEEI